MIDADIEFVVYYYNSLQVSEKEKYLSKMPKKDKPNSSTSKPVRPSKPEQVNPSETLIHWEK